MNASILIVEDHLETRELLRAAIEDAGYSVTCAGNVKDALTYLGTSKPSLLILDISLPDGSGLELCAAARGSDGLADIPVIALTGRDKLEDKKRGFACGVDQYLTKPIVMDELVMWIKALLSRVAMDKSGGTELRIGALELNVKSQLVRYAGKTVANLTRREFELLYALAKNSPAVLSRREILSQVWRTVSVENLVDTHLFNLRKKLPQALSRRVQAVAGKGFRYFDGE